MRESSGRSRSVAIVGVGAVLPDAPDVPTFWQNLLAGRSAIRDVPADRWDAARYWDPDPQAPDRTYSKIGGWVTDEGWDPLGWRLPIPPKVAASMDRTQRYAIIAARQALLDYGHPERPLDGKRTAVVLGNSMGGDDHLFSSARILFPDLIEGLEDAPVFASLPADVRAAVLEELRAGVRSRVSDITEDTMPGELSNIAAGRVASLWDFHGPNFVTDAACASAMAALYAAIDGLENGEYDAVLTGGSDANMSASAFTKFSKIGALSATGSRPYAEGADGFVMAEGAAVFVLKRLADAERDGDRIYAVVRGVAGSSDGRGKGITAPNPIGQQLAVTRAWENAGVAPRAGDLVEGHGTSTRVGDVVEVASMNEVFAAAGLPRGALHLGSVKSNLGHLKGAAGAAGMLKSALALHHGVIPPSINFHRPNPEIDFAGATLAVAESAREWGRRPDGEPRRAGVSSFGFGGTNFHVVLEEYVPVASRSTVAVGGAPGVEQVPAKTPLRGALVIGGASEAEIATRLRAVKAEAERGAAPAPQAPAAVDLAAEVRLAIDYADAPELADLSARALEALETGDPGRWRALRNRGVFLGRGRPGRVAFLFTGQGSQYVNMLRDLRNAEPIVADTFAEADRVMEPLIGSTLTSRIFLENGDEAAAAAAEEALKQTSITQPAVLAVDTSLARLMNAYGVAPDMVMGHSLGEYGALVAADALSFADALVAVSTRGKSMTHLSGPDTGLMAAVFGDLEKVRGALETVDGYVVIANVNSTKECVIGGATAAVEAAMTALREAGFRAQPLPVSHAFHTEIVAGAAVPLMNVLRELDVRVPQLPVVANVDGELYPTGPDAGPAIVELLGKQIGSPVQFVKGLGTLYDAGVRVFVEMGPKRVLYGFAEDVLGDRDDVVALYTNHPRNGDVVSFNRALCGLYAAGLGRGVEATRAAAPAPPPAVEVRAPEPVSPRPAAPAPALVAPVPSAPVRAPAPAAASPGEDRYVALGRLFADFLDRSFATWSGGAAPEPVRLGITGASVGLPGGQRVFDERNLERILAGEALIGSVPPAFREAMAGRRITRLVKGPDGQAEFETIDDPADVIKLAGRAGAFDLVGEFGYPADRVEALDRVTRLAMAAGLDALRDAGIPLVMRHKATTTGGTLPDGWALPESMRDDTGVIMASAFPGYDAFARTLEGYHADRARRERLEELRSVRAGLAARGESTALPELDERIGRLEGDIDAAPFRFDRRFLFQVLSMGHSQFAEYIGARGPNAQTNAACASGTQAVALASDWITTGRCRRVIVLSADDITSDALLPWFGAGFLASGAAATDERLEDAALPFDRRRHGLLIGMGGAALVVEALASSEERGLTPICEVLGTVSANSAFHGSRLDTGHIAGVMERLVAEAEQRWGIDRHAMAGETVFVSHETYTPARGGSASAEVLALRRVFGSDADRVVIANTKGFTGHPMGVAIEDALAVKMLETGVVPPVANFREVDPELGMLNLSRGGSYPVRYALRLGAGFGSQIAMSLVRWTPPPDGARRRPGDLGFHHRIADRAAWERWLAAVGGEGAELEMERRVLRVKQVPGRRPVAAPAPASAPRPAAPMAPGPMVAAVAAGHGASATAPVPAAADDDAVRQRVLAIVAEQTGYPPDMLDLDLDLEADLGIDTVKQAEMFAAIRAEYAIERDENLALRDYPTLKRAMEFVYEKRPDLARGVARPVAAQPGAAQSAGPVAAETPVAAGADDPVRAAVLRIVAEQTGYPPDMLDLDLDLEADLGIDTVKQAEMFAAIRAEYAIERDENLALRDYPTLKRAIEFVYEKRPDLAPVAAQPVAAQPGAAESAGPIAAETPAAADDPVRAVVLRIVAEQTGYPPDMLDLDLDLEADLGIDTVKQAEMFAAIRAEYAIERDENLALRDYPTLKRAIEFVYEKRPDLAPGSGAPVEMVAPVADASPAEVVVEKGEPELVGDMAAAQGLPRRIPVPRLRPDTALFRETGVRLAEGDRVVVFPDRDGAAEALVARLEARGVTPLMVDGAPTADALAEQLAAWRAEGAIAGLYWLPALDGVEDAELLEDREPLRVRVKLLYATLRALYDDLGAAGAFVVTGTRLGGRHGYDEAGATDVPGGAVVGLTKSFAREKPDALVKAVDFAPEEDACAVADRLLEETLRDPGVVEVGRADGRRWTVGLETRPVEAEGELPGGDAVWVVTGAAGSITSAILRDLAAGGGTFWLLDLTEAPDRDDPALQRLATDRDGLKREIFERLQASGERATPARVERELAALERSAAALAAMRAVEDAGGTVHWRSLDLRDADAVKGVMAEALAECGRVDVLVHAAGLEISRALPDKTPEEFDLVFDVKVEGWLNLMAGLDTAPLGAAVVFSSIAGRFGNAGQADYSAANDLLCKAVSAFRRTRPEARGVALDWTAWGGIGMATRGSIPAIMKAAGIDMLAPAAGIPVVRRELLAGTRDEVVVAGALGAMLAERVPGGGLDEAAVEALRTHAGPMVGTVGLDTHAGLVVTTELDPATQPFLHDHRIGGTPVLPGVMGIEAMCEAAQLAFPELRVAAVEDVAFHAPFKFYRDEPRTVTVRAVHTMDGEDVVAACALLGERTLHGRAEAEVTTHFTARVRLTAAPVDAPAPRAVPEEGEVVAPAAVYDVYFHGPAYQVLGAAWRTDGVLAGRLAADLPPNHDPANRPTLLAPRLVELAFQTAGLAELADAGRMALPHRVDRIEVASAPGGEPAGAAALLVGGDPEDGWHLDVVNGEGRPLLHLHGYRTSPLPDPVDGAPLAALRASVAAGG